MRYFLYTAAALSMAALILAGCGRQKADTRASDKETAVSDTGEMSSASSEPDTESFPGGGESFPDAGVKDGTYRFDGILEGGSGRASFDGPLTLQVKDRKATLTFTMSSENYDYVIVDGQKYLPVSKSGNSTFTVPVEKINCDFAFTGDTVAMSTPHEIDYTVRICAGDLKKAE